MSRRKRRRPHGGAPAPGPSPYHPPDCFAAGYEVVETPPPPALSQALLVAGVNTYLRCYRVGAPGDTRDACTAIVTREYGAWHISVSNPRRYPTWLEISTLRYRVVPDAAWMMMALPPPEEFVNIGVGVKTMHLVEVDRAAVKGETAAER